jgi:hypothetical protein
MANHENQEARNDRGLIHHLTPVFPGFARAVAWTNGLTSWFRPILSAGRRPGVLETAWCLFGARRLQPVFVHPAARRAAVMHLTARGHFTRI